MNIWTEYGVALDDGTVLPAANSATAWTYAAKRGLVVVFRRVSLMLSEQPRQRAAVHLGEWRTVRLAAA